VIETILVFFSGVQGMSGEGVNITEAIKEGRKYDHSRYWMYGGNAYAHPAEEIIGPRYPLPIELEMTDDLRLWMNIFR